MSKKAENLEKIFQDESKERDTHDELVALCHEVASLDDAGLGVFHKSAIRRAKILARKIAKE